MSVLAANSAVVWRGKYPQRPMIGGYNRTSEFVMIKCWSGAGLDPGDWKKKKRSRRCRSGTKAADLSRSDAAVEIENIEGSDQLDQILLQARHRSQPILIDWMAAWCRKCIYLKPRLEKLAAEYKEKIRFYYVDVNNVSRDLVKRGNISKMPTIQVWKDGEMKEEVIGGHKAWAVLEEVREMIQRFV